MQPYNKVAVEFQNVTVSINNKQLVSDLNFSVHQGEALILLGRSGSGKTTTIVKALEYIPLALLVELGSIPRPQSFKDLTILNGKEELIASYIQKYPVAFLAFNKHIAKELKRRVPDYVHVSTLHSLGYSLMKSKFPDINVEEDKVGMKMDNIWPISKTYKDADGNEVEIPQNVKGSIS